MLCELLLPMETAFGVTQNLSIQRNCQGICYAKCGVIGGAGPRGLQKALLN